MSHLDADRPKTAEGREYHLHTKAGDLAPYCLLVGDPDRAEMIASKFLKNAVKVGDHRGLKSFTGENFDGLPVSVVTTGMGGASIGIVLPEAVRSGARTFIRVGSCGALRKEVRVGDIAVCTAAVRLDGASENWAPMEWPAAADWRVTAALAKAAKVRRVAAHFGIGVTTACFNEGQARPDDAGYVPRRIRQRHKEFVRRGALFYSMEEAAMFVWCSTHGGIPCGAVNAVFANRVTGEFGTLGEETAAEIALMAVGLLRLSGSSP